MIRRTIYGHIDTIRPSLFPFTTHLYTDREIVNLPDQDFVVLHYPAPLQANKTILLIPGMASNRNAPVILAAVRELLANGYTPVVVELRNCSDIPGKSAGYFNAGSTADVDVVIRYLCNKIGAPLRGVIGFSLGGIVMSQWAAKNDLAQHFIHQLHCISVPLDLGLTAKIVNEGFSRLYQKVVLSRYRRLLKRRHDAATVSIANKLDRIKSMIDFDEQITVPLNGYQCLEQYYTENSALQFLKEVRIPCRLTNSINDPLIPYNRLYRQLGAQPTFELDLLPGGGHLGLFHASIRSKLKQLISIDSEPAKVSV